MDIFITWIVVMITQVYTYVQTHQIVYINYVQFFFTNYISIKLEKKPSTLKIIDMQLLARASTYLIRGRSRVQTLMCLTPARAFNIITLPLLHSSEDGSAPRWVKQFPGPTIYGFFFLMGMFFRFQILTQMDLGKCNSFISGGPSALNVLFNNTRTAGVP